MRTCSDTLLRCRNGSRATVGVREEPRRIVINLESNLRWADEITFGEDSSRGL